MTAPTLSVVIPAFNNGRTIAETIESILDQQGVDFELIVADHSSGDDTRDIAEDYRHDPRVTILETPGGGGAARNWNRVTAAATGEYIKLVCGDDLLRPGVLARQVEILRSSGAVLTACKRDIIDVRGGVLKRGWGLRGIERSLPGSIAVRKAVIAGSNLFGEPASVMMRRALLADVGGWFSEFPYLIDQATYSRVLLEGDFAPDPQIGATFRMSTTQWSVALTNDQARQARGFHEWLRRDRPDIISRADLLRGNANATMMAHARRASYWLLKKRMG
ncbi:glycosyltransferase family 2 protein [Microbacterium sp. CCNWLW134]|uniref:glycosyltransferase family 2 protein n=1 Tax=Microbacterium sp. CCNWLW134 TaxID=3122064 RepID=UPI00300F8949